MSPWPSPLLIPSHAQMELHQPPAYWSLPFSPSILTVRENHSCLTGLTSASMWTPHLIPDCTYIPKPQNPSSRARLHPAADDGSWVRPKGDWLHAAAIELGHVVGQGLGQQLSMGSKNMGASLQGKHGAPRVSPWHYSPPQLHRGESKHVMRNGNIIKG